MTTTADAKPSALFNGRRTEVSQWRAHSLQVANWGGFDGLHSIDLDVTSALLSGASGTGKSTILDAYIALMMDSNTPFNGASNDNVMGRARSAEQRNVLSYVRGKIDESRDPETGKVRDIVLRGDGKNTWSAIAMTWVNDDGRHLTAMRLYYAPAATGLSRDVKIEMAIYPDRFDLASVEPFARQDVAFHNSRMRTAFPGLDFFTSYAKFAAALHKRLGIGKQGDGASAMKLLARIQGGRQVTSVDTLYKDMVLERPRTYEAADEALEHFATLESSYQTMITAQQQADALSGIEEQYAALTAARAETALIDTFCIAQPDDALTPFLAWAADRESAMLDAEIADVRAAKDRAELDHAEATQEVARLDALLAANRRQQWENGGGALDALTKEIEALRADQQAMAARQRTAATRTAPLGPLPTDQPGWDNWTRQAETGLTAYPADLAALRDREDDITAERVPIDTQKNNLLAERSYLAGRANLIPQDMVVARADIARATGIPATDLPFIAELIDIDPAHEKWRTAAERVLGSVARTMLVPADAGLTGREFRRLINDLNLGVRIQFDVVTTGTARTALDPDTLPGKFIFADDSPYLGWLTKRLAHGFAYECIDNPSGFQDDGRSRVTLSGQTQDGSRGAHGGTVRRILGFSNASRLTEIDDLLDAIENELARLDADRTVVREQIDDLNARRDAYMFVRDTAWPTIDVLGTLARIQVKEDERAGLLAGNDVLTHLQDEERRLDADLAQQRARAFRAETAAQAYNKEWGDLAERQDQVGDLLTDLHDAAVTVAADQVDRLDAEYAKFATTGKHAEFRAVVRKVRAELNDRLRQAGSEALAMERALTTTFRQFNARWDTGPNIGVEVESYDHYLGLLDALRSEGLGERREAFRNKVIEWSGEDLLALQGSLNDAFDDILERLYPVNAILAALPFGPRKDRLFIHMTRTRAADMDRFRTELRALASGLTDLGDDDAVERRFKDLQAFMARLRKAPGSERDYLLDVRRHIHVVAERRDPLTQEALATYDSLGGKSGGETQELIAFIVGAALRYQLGDEDLDRPVYAPVFLDEGFVKSDSEFAGRAVQAWLGLGFQLIIGAPLDKVTAIEPHVARMISVTKSATGRSRAMQVDNRDTTNGTE
jgi:uncharacterized protein YPO0396